MLAVLPSSLRFRTSYPLFFPLGFRTLHPLFSWIMLPAGRFPLSTVSSVAENLADRASQESLSCSSLCSRPLVAKCGSCPSRAVRRDELSPRPVAKSCPSDPKRHRLVCSLGRRDSEDVQRPHLRCSYQPQRVTCRNFFRKRCEASYRTHVAFRGLTGLRSLVKR